MRLKRYTSDITTQGWQCIEKIIFVQRTSKWDLKEIVNAIFYVTKNGCVWRDLPGEFPAWQTVYWYYQKWIGDGTWKNISDCLIVDYREKKGRNAQPSVAIIDSQSSKNSSTCTEEIGIDGGKLIKGRKRFLIVDTLGCVLESFVVPANNYDGIVAAEKWEVFGQDHILLSHIEKVYADATFGGTFKQSMKEYYGVEVIIPSVPMARNGKVDIHQGRWIVERSIAWTGNNRRCAKDYERKVESANAYIIIANIRRLEKKI
jgi:putative transposase